MSVYVSQTYYNEERGDTMEIILSVRSCYCPKFITGQKNHEFRTKIPKKGEVNWILVYEMAPVKALRYALKIEETISDHSKVPDDNRDGNHEFHHQISRYQYAYRISDVYELNHPIPLNTLKEKYHLTPPRGFAYLDSYPELKEKLANSQWTKQYHYE